MPENQLVERLHGLLSHALQQNRPRPFDSPVTVAEIYQDLVPYRSVRTALGFQMNADYEHTLLRLLAGENGLARLEPAEARDELQSELDTPNPNVGLFRKFAACDVWVTPGEPIEVHPPAVNAPAEVQAPIEAHVPVEPAPEADAAPPVELAPEPAPATTDPEPAAWSTGAEVDPRTWSAEAEAEQQDADEWEASLPELILEEEVSAPSAGADSIPPAPAPEPPPAKPSQPTDATTMPEAAVSPAATTRTGSCAFCASDLPVGRSVRFCPFCGQDQSLRPCATCAEPLEPEWTFCIACGARQDAA
ncbi:MAG: hypothetical protein PVH00_05615 [Gemmatimonadota bacterium]|jgi:hypothetical protein